jgi:hypothetical protein
MVKMVTKNSNMPDFWATVVRLILLDFASYLIYYTRELVTRKKVTYELLTHEYNYWRRADESVLLP